MSANNGIYIAKFEDGYRVTETSAIDNAAYPSIDHPDALKIQKRMFSGESFDNEKDALERANEIYDQIMNSSLPILEYGIQKIEFPHEYPNNE